MAKYAATKKAQDPDAWRAMEKAKKKKQRQQKKKPLSVNDILAKALQHEADESKRLAKGQAEQSKLEQKTRDMAMTKADSGAAVLHNEDEDEDDIPADPPIDDGHSVAHSVVGHSVGPLGLAVGAPPVAHQRPANRQGAYHALLSADRPIVTTVYRRIEVDTRNSNDLTTVGARWTHEFCDEHVPREAVFQARIQQLTKESNSMNWYKADAAFHKAQNARLRGAGAKRPSADNTEGGDDTEGRDDASAKRH